MGSSADEIATIIARGDLPIRKEYLKETIEVSVVTTDPSTADGSNTNGDAGSSKRPLDGANDGEENANKKQRGTNLSRHKHMKVEKQNMCHSWLYQGACAYGQGCRFSHDLTDFLKTRPTDLDIDCPYYEKLGKCSYGVMCRAGKKHFLDGKSLIDEEKVKIVHAPSEVNSISREVQGQLRKRTYNFSKAYDVVKAVRAMFNIPEAKGEPEDLDTTEAATAEGNQAEGAEEKDIVADPSAAAVTTTTDIENGKAAESSVEKPQDGAVKSGMEMTEVQATSVSVETKVEGEASTVASASATSHVATAKDAELDPNDRLGKLRPSEKKKIDFRDKLYLAPLTTVGNLPFRRLCKRYGADITCGEMAMCTKLVAGQASEWALLRRHESEDIFGVQICGGNAEIIGQCSQLLEDHCSMDFVDLNCGCPIDIVCKKGCGAGMMDRPRRVESAVRTMSNILSVPVTIKLRLGPTMDHLIAHKYTPKLADWGACATVMHGRTRQQRYSKLANWDYIEDCARLSSVPIIGNGDIYTWEDVEAHKQQHPDIATVMIARGAIIKPWIFTEIKEKRHWDITASERLEMIKLYSSYGLEHWGSDHKGVETTRRFLLEFLSFLYRYTPVGILEMCNPKMNLRPPPYSGRNDLETLFASSDSRDWTKISEMVLGPVPDGFKFTPKHKSNSYETNG
eukprot:TRINITY_DN1187_c0_g1::TRINITY_DN1187_c0_g1_i1::g.17224::m.17224 TRINITY_DN1187_c0_g1::TRINITY_DN1187_c0_g1_i1::g.17224  ORF type:complete len:681 (-),score=142.33,sp/Q96G46/DUS3L_HUMAN/43.41/1e-176,Dus/PF01207.12/1.8e+03,Dus/PF01207.12/1.1e-53,zf-CCCH/PF00642.19/0.027,zf-CCCH/PF00642.19/0.06,zf-CCCH/PF00642.19/3.9e+02,ketoacyl-synt/PF00109.21/0.0071 TRINITY_DN1187_c0_g1_i1:21-2063(-)